MGYLAEKWHCPVGKWKSYFQIPDSRFQFPEVSGFAKMALSEYPSFQTAPSPNPLAKYAGGKLETGN
eukprot:2939463-Prymnesium_polylepis.1